jgi:hypothetical protein
VIVSATLDLVPDTALMRVVTRLPLKSYDAVLAAGGTYYLPYQLVATRAQFLRAYPAAPRFFALKERLDPTCKFRNRLWERYDTAPACQASPPPP